MILETSSIDFASQSIHLTGKRPASQQSTSIRPAVAVLQTLNYAR